MQSLKEYLFLGLLAGILARAQQNTFSSHPHAKIYQLTEKPMFCFRLVTSTCNHKLTRLPTILNNSNS
jgi:hypothetical protein